MGRRWGQEENEWLVFSSVNTYGLAHTTPDVLSLTQRTHTDARTSYWVLSYHDQIKPQ